MSAFNSVIFNVSSRQLVSQPVYKVRYARYQGSLYSWQIKAVLKCYKVPKHYKKSLKEDKG